MKRCMMFPGMVANDAIVLGFVLEGRLFANDAISGCCMGQVGYFVLFRIVGSVRRRAVKRWRRFAFRSPTRHDLHLSLDVCGHR